MKKSIKNLTTLAIFCMVAACSLGVTADAHAVGVAYYGTTQWTNYGPQYIYSTSSWTTNSTNNSVTINGWQNTGVSSMPANEVYAVVESSVFGWSSNWVEWPCTGNYTSGGTWYGHQFIGIPNNKTVKIRVENKSIQTVDLAGNAYQS
ncbi:hypothetical protein [Tumebacillus permanentifrigoris]|uniref:Uncharacterized protein n=1 Tax=Tumebacillus permanentifrigoris TaxID=378543 RepID=A0A316D9Q9_9BACL|nr:hypothetical protein [Tumebacillus permanentifrigoris]PWK13480.1 hypothetical protein C7459_107148 [Tumebacillus permanentifrigoris]